MSASKTFWQRTKDKIRDDFFKSRFEYLIALNAACSLWYWHRGWIFYSGLFIGYIIHQIPYRRRLRLEAQSYFQSKKDLSTLGELIRLTGIGRLDRFIEKSKLN